MGLRQNAAKPSKAGAKAQQAATTPVTAALLFHDSDADPAGQLAGLLSGAGVTVLPPAAPVDTADAVVVFLSAKGLGSPEWVAQATVITQTATRLIPVRVGTIDDQQVPGRLREVNWIDWRPGSVEATFGSVLAGMLSDPDRRDVSRRSCMKPRHGCGPAAVMRCSSPTTGRPAGWLPCSVTWPQTGWRRQLT